MGPVSITSIGRLSSPSLSFHALFVAALSPLPNKRLKLTGAHQYGRIALPRRRAFFSAAPPPCASGPCARSLSASRKAATSVLSMFRTTFISLVILGAASARPQQGTFPWKAGDSPPMIGGIPLSITREAPDVPLGPADK